MEVTVQRLVALFDGELGIQVSFAGNSSYWVYSNRRDWSIKLLPDTLRIVGSFERCTE